MGYGRPIEKSLCCRTRMGYMRRRFLPTGTDWRRLARMGTCVDGTLQRATRSAALRLASKGGLEPGMYAFSSGGEMFAFCKETGTVSFWDVVRGTRMGFLEAGGIPKCLAFSPNGKKLAVGYEETNANFHGVGLWDLGRRVKILLLTNGTVESRSLASLRTAEPWPGDSRMGRLSFGTLPRRR